MFLESIKNLLDSEVSVAHISRWVCRNNLPSNGETVHEWFSAMGSSAHHNLLEWVASFFLEKIILIGSDTQRPFSNSSSSYIWIRPVATAFRRMARGRSHRAWASLTANMGRYSAGDFWCLGFPFPLPRFSNDLKKYIEEKPSFFLLRKPSPCG